MTAAFNDIKLVIFDLDGVVVDSEILAARALSETLQSAGVPISPADVIENFLGRSAPTIRQILKNRYGYNLTPATEQGNLERLFALFTSDLKPVPGVRDLLGTLQLPYCLASSSTPDRIQVALRATDLLEHFAGRIFSASMVRNGKPAPDLFLHAAAEMGMDPRQCLVIEDSPAGLLAARAAGMKVIAFTGGAHLKDTRITGLFAGTDPDLTLDSMTEINAVITASLARSNFIKS